jgi:hypothetical protein
MMNYDKTPQAGNHLHNPGSPAGGFSVSYSYEAWQWEIYTFSTYSEGCTPEGPSSKSDQFIKSKKPNKL